MSVAAAWVVRALLALLILFTLFIEVYFVPQLGLEIIKVSPEAAPLFAPALIWAILVIGCGQAILLIVWRLVSLVAQERVFSASALSWVRAIIGISLSAVGLLVAAFVVLNIVAYTPPIAMYGLIGLVLFCVTFALIMRTMLGLLRRSTRLHDEMAEVI